MTFVILTNFVVYPWNATHALYALTIKDDPKTIHRTLYSHVFTIHNNDRPNYWYKQVYDKTIDCISWKQHLLLASDADYCYSVAYLRGLNSPSPHLEIVTWKLLKCLTGHQTIGFIRSVAGCRKMQLNNQAQSVLSKFSFRCVFASFTSATWLRS